MPSPTISKKAKSSIHTDVPWSVLVLDDPVNLMSYVTIILKRVFGYSEERATTLMMEIHTSGRAIVWTGAKERAEFYVQQLHGSQLKSTMEKSV